MPSTIAIVSNRQRATYRYKSRICSICVPILCVRLTQTYFWSWLLQSLGYALRWKKEIFKVLILVAVVVPFFAIFLVFRSRWSGDTLNERPRQCLFICLLFRLIALYWNLATWKSEPEARVHQSMTTFTYKNGWISCWFSCSRKFIPHWID